jgi:nitroimidazol reductase NimA-like FMN-containing flavoprotein (pyridoxamine 5'-phosphate oxidase superfamily)
MPASEDTLRLLRGLLTGERLAVLSTHGAGQPYASLVAFAAADDLRCLYFATPRSTRKFANLQGDCRVALLVSSSRNQEADFHAAAAVTVLGSAGELSGPEREAALPGYLQKHPYLEDFVRAPTCALVKVHVRTCILVKNFQHVMELHLEP